VTRLQNVQEVTQEAKAHIRHISGTN